MTNFRRILDKMVALQGTFSLPLISYMDQFSHHTFVVLLLYFFSNVLTQDWRDASGFVPLTTVAVGTLSAPVP